MQIEEYDSLLITGCTNAKETMEDLKTLEFIEEFYNAGVLIGSISIASGFRQWAMAIGRELNIEYYPQSFDLEIE